MRSWLVGIAAALVLQAAPGMADASIADRIRDRMETAGAPDSLEVMEERLHARNTLQRLYAVTAYAPLWVTDTGPTGAALALLEWIESETPRHGLDPIDYHVAVLDAVDDSDRTPALVDLELAMSDAFLLLASDLLAGHLNPETLDPEWRANRRHRDLVPVIEQAARNGDPGAVLAGLLPNDPGYGALVGALERMRRIRTDGGWSLIATGPTLHPGESGERVAELGRRLAATGDFEGPVGADFGTELAAAVTRFQSRHGLVADGIVGKDTLAALNVSANERVRQLVVNLERWRWLPESLGNTYVIVNIAGFSLDVVENGESALAMRVVVGRPYRRTPVFSGEISYLVLNPSWDVPRSIAVEDKLPLIKADPGYLAEQGFTVLENPGAGERVVDPATIDWQAITANDFPYRLRQAPGPMNALGRVKFMFPNDFAVYLHDTPSRELFARESRPFSSGCIRLERPLDLAEYLLRDSPAWDRAEIDRVVASGQEKTVMLHEKVPVHLLYWTSWVDADGTLQFRDDIYGRDSRVLKNLRLPPPDN